MDLYGSPEDKDPVSSFVQLLWDRGSTYEQKVIDDLTTPFVNLSSYSADEKELRTSEEMDKKTPLIYGGRIRFEGFLGEPDLLRLEDCGYVPGDIKSGSGEEGPEDNSRPKLRYAVQLGLYVDILERLGRLTDRRAFVWDISGNEVLYDFMAPLGRRDSYTLWQKYQSCLNEVSAIIHKTQATSPALSAPCKLCIWRTSCYTSMKSADDLTLLPELGRAKRDVLVEQIPTIHDLANDDISRFIQGRRSSFYRIGPDSLQKFQARAKLHAIPGSSPYTREQIDIPRHDTEIFYDVETDPMSDICYLHGFMIRSNSDEIKEEYVHFFVTEATFDAEKVAFQKTWQFLCSQIPCAIYYYSPYERTILRRLQNKYPDVCDEESIESLFANDLTIDLYTDIVRPKTEWPTHDYSIKTLGKYLGFTWRDIDPSGAESIEWFNQWIKTNDAIHKQRILEYNEDDCRAMRVLLDGLLALPVC